MQAPVKPRKNTRFFRMSIRYKLALPVLVLVSLMLFLLFRTTFRTVRAVVLERSESRLRAIAEVFAETIKVPLVLKYQSVLEANIDWMSKRPDVLEVRVEDMEGSLVGGGSNETHAMLPKLERDFLGVKSFGRDVYAVGVPIEVRGLRRGRVLIFFSQQYLEVELQEIFQRRLLQAFLMAVFLALLMAGLTWIALRPIFTLKRTAEKILAGDLSARARIRSFDEIEDLGEAFNEMVARLARSLDNLRLRTEALEESEEKYRLVIENAGDIIFTLTPEGEMPLLNKEISGCTREELLLEGLGLLLSLETPESRQKFEEELEKVSRTKQAVTNIPSTHIHRASKTEISYLVNLTPMLDYDGNVKVIQGVMRDVTELRRIELMKESLIRDVAHELKTPTAKFEMAVGWFEKELEKQGEIAKYGQVMHILKANVERLMRTITSIMDLSRLESGMTRLAEAELDLNEVLEQVRQDMEPICRDKKIILEARFSPERLAMMGDRDMLYRLFLNLIGNAAKFTPGGTIRVASKKEMGRILVSVRDSGIGVDKDDLEKIFDRFVQKTASSQGIGVGLTISRDIAVLHRGRIWAESEGLGKGAIFKVEFPAL